MCFPLTFCWLTNILTEYQAIVSMSKTGNYTASDSDDESKDSKQGVLAEIWDMAWLPVLLALLAVLLTWVVWYNTTDPGKPDSAKPTGCSWSDWENVSALIC